MHIENGKSHCIVHVFQYMAMSLVHSKAHSPWPFFLPVSHYVLTHIHRFAFLALDGKHGRYTQTVSADEILNLTQRLGLDNSSAISALDGIGKGTDAQVSRWV